jgi:hypothetical protein
MVIESPWMICQVVQQIKILNVNYLSINLIIYQLDGQITRKSAVNVGNVVS